MKQITLLLLLAINLYACQKLDDKDNSPNNIPHTLTLRTRAGDAISYPVYLYVFDEEEQCVGAQTISSASQSISFTLPNGVYKLSAFAGVGNDYQMPTGNTPTDKITLKTGNKATTALSVGVQNINLTSDTNVDMTLQYATTKIEACITNVPDEYTTVAFKLSPIYSAITLCGDFTGAGQSVEIACQKDNSGNWTCDPTYIFPGSNVQTTISIILGKSNGNKTDFDYNYHGAPQANHPFKINANFASQSKMAISLSMSDWSTTTTVDFNFGKEQTTSSTIKESEIPSTRDIWEEGIVFDIQRDNNALKILVLDLFESPQAILTTEVASYFSFEDGWRLPTSNEAELLNTRFSGYLGEINKAIQDADDTYYTLKTSLRYLCTKENESSYYSYSFNVGGTVSKAGEKTKYLGRMVKGYDYTVIN